MIIFVFLLFVLLYNNKHIFVERFEEQNKKPFVCLSREYIKNDNDEYEPVQEVICGDLDEKTCKEQEADCVAVEVDIETFHKQNSEEVKNELNKMFGHCMIKNPNVKLDKKCLKRQTSLMNLRRSRLGKMKRTNQYKTILKKCELKSKDKYVLDTNCKLF